MYEYEQAGVAAIHLEDQVGPKRCGHMSGKSAIALEDMVAKLSAAADVRARCTCRSGFRVDRRTDALAGEGVDAAIMRASLCGSRRGRALDRGTGERTGS